MPAIVVVSSVKASCSVSALKVAVPSADKNAIPLVVTRPALYDTTPFAPSTNVMSARTSAMPVIAVDASANPVMSVTTASDRVGVPGTGAPAGIPPTPGLEVATDSIVSVAVTEALKL